MKISRVTVNCLALALSAGVACSAAPAASHAPMQAYGRDRGDWSAPPPELQGLERQGFHDGMDGARKDFGNHRQPNVENRDEYRHPNLPRDQWDVYRRGFRRGYQVAASHLWGTPPPDDMRPQAPPPPPPPDEGRNWQGDRDRDHGPNAQIRQRGFQDGMLGAIRDLGNGRRPDPNNRDEYRNPDVPYPMQDAYRDGFRRGYEIAIHQIEGEDYRGLAQGPGGEVRQRGYQDGFAGAIRDFGNNRRPDPNNRDEYRSPNVPYAMQDAYRDGFRRGYSVAMSLLTRGPDNDDHDHDR